LHNLYLMQEKQLTATKTRAVKSFNFQHIKGDLLGGLTAAIIGLPTALAFGVQSGLGAEAGLYTAILLAIVAALIGGTATLISDPTGPMTILGATIISGFLAANANSIEAAMPLIIGTFLLTGIFQIIFGFLGIAKYVKFMPYPVLSGFMGGIGVIIIIFQLFPLMGASSPKGILAILTGLGAAIQSANLQALGLGLATIAVIYLTPLVSKKIPAILFALVIMTAISAIFSFDVAQLGAISLAVPSFKASSLLNFPLGQIGTVVVSGITLAALGTIDSLLTSTVADKMTKTRHNGSKELIGQGLGNMLVAMIGGLPGAGTTTGTVANIKSGARTKLSGISKGFFLFIMLIGFGNFIQYIPLPVLAGILTVIGIGIIDLRGLKLIPRAPIADSAILITTLLVTIFDNLLDAVAIGSMLAAILFMKKMSDSILTSNKTGTLASFLKNENLPEKLAQNVYIEHLEGPLFFGFADDFKSQIQEIEGVEIVVMHMDQVPFMDETGMLVLEEAIIDLEKRGIDVLISGMKAEVSNRLRKVGIIPSYIKENEVFNNFDDCMLYLAEYYNCCVTKERLEAKLQEALREVAAETN
jgi:SulP family sulfate permease